MSKERSNGLNVCSVNANAFCKPWNILLKVAFLNFILVVVSQFMDTTMWPLTMTLCYAPFHSICPEALQTNLPRINTHIFLLVTLSLKDEIAKNGRNKLNDMLIPRQIMKNILPKVCILFYFYPFPRQIMDTKDRTHFVWT